MRAKCYRININKKFDRVIDDTPSVSIRIWRRHELSRGHRRRRLISFHILPGNHSRIDDNCTTPHRDMFQKFDPFFGGFDFSLFLFIDISTYGHQLKKKVKHGQSEIWFSSSNLNIFYTNCVSTRCGKWPRWGTVNPRIQSN